MTEGLSSPASQRGQTSEQSFEAIDEPFTLCLLSLCFCGPATNCAPHHSQTGGSLAASRRPKLWLLAFDQPGSRDRILN